MNIQVGWLCPRCGKVNAPWMAQCSCDDKLTRDSLASEPPMPNRMGMGEHKPLERNPDGSWYDDTRRTLYDISTRMAQD